MIVKDIKVFESANPNVKKYVFDFDDAIAEAVVYKYPTYAERTVICCSVMSGCPVGCVFCGTGKRFIRNLSSEEIVVQVIKIVEDIEKAEGYRLNSVCKKFQVMFMSMGEPMLNYQIFDAIDALSAIYWNAQLLVSTMGVDDSFWMARMFNKAELNEKIGLQFSIHQSNDAERNLIIPYKNKLTLQDIRDYGITFWKITGRKVYLNYCITDTNSFPSNIEELRNLFSPIAFAFTFSVVCTTDHTVTEHDITGIEIFRDEFPEYDTRIFNPAGQDDIGGGCGQLWYVQDWMKNRVKED